MVVMYDTPDETHTHLCHDLPFHIEDGVPVIDNPPTND